MSDLNALIAQGVQFKAPPDPFEQYGRMQQLTQNQQLNQLNMMKLDETRRTSEDMNALRMLDPASPDYLRNVSRINPQKGFEFGKLQHEAASAKLKAQADTSALIDTRLKQSRQFLENVTTPEQYLAWHRANHSDDVIGPLLASRGITAEAAEEKIRLALQQGPEAFQQLINQSKLGVEKFADMNKPDWQDAGGTLQPMSQLTGQPMPGVKPIQKTMTPGQGEQIRLGEARIAQGERRLDGIEARAAAASQGKPLTALQQQKRGKDTAKSTGLLRGLNNQVDNLVAAANDINSHPGLSAATGLTGMLPSYPGGDASKVDGLIEEFKSNVKKAGLDFVREGGSIGQMTEREWPIVESMVANVDPKAGPSQLKSQMEKVIAKVDQIRQNAYRVHNETFDADLSPPSGGQPPPAGASQIPTNAAPAAGAPMYATNPTTKQRIVSTDGGNTWAPAR